VVTAIKKALRSRGLQPGKGEPPRRRPGTAGTSIPVAELRSSNFRVKKEFTDYDTDRFLKEGFGYMANFFEHSLDELVRRNPRLERDFRRIDARRFNAAV